MRARALHVALELNPGDRVGLWGHNGAGKPPLLAGAYAPTSGTIRIQGEVTSLIDLALGMEPEATGLENIDCD